MQHHSYLRRRAAIVCLTTSLILVPAWADSQSENLPNFQKVDDHVYRGGQPTDMGFENLAQLGVKTVVDLRDIGEHSQAHEQKVVTDLGMRYINVPMHGMSAPKNDQVAAVQALFHDTANGPVFVHCRRGADRTGMVVAVYRVSHDQWENQKALDEAKSRGMSFFARSIQHYVMDFKPALVAASGGAVPASPLTGALGIR